MRSVIFALLATLVSIDAISLSTHQKVRRDDGKSDKGGDDVPYLDLVTDLIGRYKYVPENSTSCPSAYALIVTKEKEYVRSFCENGRKLYTFGKMESLNDDYVVEYPTPLDSEGEFKRKIEFLDLGFKYNEDSTLNDCEADKIPEDKFIELMGDFEESRDGKNCKKYRYVSFYSDGAYTIIGCPKMKNGKQVPGKVEEGIYAINNITNTEVSLDLQPPQGYKYRGAVIQSEKDRLNFKGIDLIRCLTKKPGSDVATDDIDDFDFDEPMPPTPAGKDKAPLIQIDLGIDNKKEPEKKATLVAVDAGIGQKPADKPVDKQDTKDKAPLLNANIGIAQKKDDKSAIKDKAVVNLDAKANLKEITKNLLKVKTLTTNKLSEHNSQDTEL